MSPMGRGLPMAAAGAAAAIGPRAVANGAGAQRSRQDAVPDAFSAAAE